MAENTLHDVPGDGPPPGIAPRLLGPADPRETITVTVKVRSRDDEAARRALETSGAEPVGARQHVARHNFGATHGADPADLRKVEDFARSAGLDVVEASSSKRRVVLSGEVAAFDEAFGVTLGRYTLGGAPFRWYPGSARVPADLEPVVEAVLGLGDRPMARPHFRRRPGGPGQAPRAGIGPVAFTPPQVARLYDFPAGLDGSGQCVAIVELGGGYRTDDLGTYFRGLGLEPPAVSAVSVLGAANTPGGDADGEVMLDIEVAGAVAPRAKFVVYFAPNTTQGFVRAVTDAAHDAANKPSVISISWGGPEDSWRDADRTALDNAIRDAGLLGVTVTVASGDGGSADGEADGKAHVDFPASSPNALACGGTRLIAADSADTAIGSEVVWNDGGSGGATGGGVSDSFPLPGYQAGVGVPPSVNPGNFAGRGVPDVAGDADPQSGYEVRVDGADDVIGGTSAVAPLWAGLIALCNQKIGKPSGFLNPLLYRAAGAFRPITQGNNGAYRAGPGWNPCTGLGSPDGAAILAALDPPPAADGP